MNGLKSYRMVDEDYCDNTFYVVPSDVYLKSEADEVIRRLKYRRCIRIISDIRAAMDNAFFVSGEYLDWLSKWHERWLKLAEKFKETKCR